MRTLVFFLEEPSAKELLEGLLPRMISKEINVRYIIFRGKQDLEKNLIKRLRGWQLPESVFIIMRDQDMADCHTVKQNLVRLCIEAERSNVLVRIACHELESFYLGDLEAVERGLNLRGLAKRQNSRKYRAPDSAIGNPAEELEKLTNKTYQKVAGSRAISHHLKLSGNCSHSFGVLLSGINKILGS